MINTPLLLEEIPETDQDALLEKVAIMIVNRQLTVPAIMVLEMCKPLNFIGSQFLLFINPFVQAIFNNTDYQKFALIIEKDQNVEKLIQKIEKLDAEKKWQKRSDRSSQPTAEAPPQKRS